MKFSFFTVFSILFFTSISYSNSDQTSEIELKKIELEEKKFDTVMEQRSSRVNSNKDQLTVKSTETSDEFDFLNGEWYGSIGNKQIRIMIESVVGNQ